MAINTNKSNFLAGTVGALAVGAAVGAYIYYNGGKKDEIKPVPKSLEVIPTPAPMNSAEILPGDAVIYFGSQTGTAEAFSKEIQDYLANNGAAADVVDLDDWSADTFVNRKIVVLVVATYGEGDPTDSAIAFNKWITSKKTEVDLSHMKFAVLGLGNRQYINYNEMARRCESHMMRLGATPFCARGECDDDQDVEADFSGWLNSSFSASYRSVFFPESSPLGKAGTQPAVSETNDDSDNVPVETSKKASLQAFLALSAQEAIKKAPALSQKFTPDAVCREMSKSGKTANPGNDVHARMYFTGLTGKVTAVKELRQVVDFAKGDSTVKVDVKLPSAHPSDSSIEGAVTYKTAHNLDILPANPAALVSAWMSLLHIMDERDLFVFFGPKLGQQDANKRPFPAPVKVKDALTWFCDLQLIPTKGTLKELAGYLTSRSERAALLELVADKNKELFTEVVKNSQMSFLEFCRICMTSLVIPLGDFLQLCPRQRPRPYTISSSSLAQPDTVSITVSRVVDISIPVDLSQQIRVLKANGFAPLASEDLTPLSSGPRVSSGVTSTWLCEATRAGNSLTGQEVRIAIKPSHFNLPADRDAPVIMVGAGTGLAPFVGLVQEFGHLAKSEETKWTGERVLIFGCQNSQRDFIYRKELQTAQDNGTLTRLITAFSREQAEKFYVQDAIRKEATYIKSLLGKKDAVIMICGATKMGSAVTEVLADVLGEDGASKVAAMRSEGRLLEELWA